MMDFLVNVGPYLVPLLALSVYSVGLIFQKRQTLRRALPLGPEAFLEVLDRAGRGEPWSDLVESAHPLGQLGSRVGEGPQRLQARAQVLLADLEDRLDYFPALANIATLTGLFATVCGMIVAFLALRSGGGSDPASLAGGLGQALGATALGLVTAIPSLVAHAVFQKQVQGTAVQMEALLTVLLGSGGPKDHG